MTGKLEKENQELRNDIKYLFNVINRNNIQMTSKEMNVFNKYYLIFNKEVKKEN